MKRIFVLFLAVLMLLSACGGSGAQTPTDKVTETSTEATTAPVTDPTTEPTEPPVLYRHPLTGEPMDTLYTGRPTAVSVNNIKACLPQYGIAAADMIYEIEAEGGVTRLVAIYTELEKAGTIGPIRSNRTYFNNIAASYDIPIVHCGGSDKALAAMYDADNKLKSWDHIDQMSNGSYFFRDKERRKQGYAYEHTLFTTGEKLLAAVIKKKYNDTYENGTDYGLQFADELTLNGASARKITITFRGKKTTKMTYNEALGKYEAYQHKRDHIDQNTGEIMSYRNVMVLQAEQTFARTSPKKVRTYYDLIGSGKGYFACDGQIVPIKWTRNTVTDQFSYTLEDGTPLTLGVGKTYIGIIALNGSAKVAYE